MKLTFGIAGVPAGAIYDSVRVHLVRRITQPHSFIMQPLKPTNGNYQYIESHRNFFCNEFARLIELDHYNALRGTAFVLIYLEYPGQNTQEFSNFFFPSTLAIPVPAPITQPQSKQALQGQAKNQIVAGLDLAITIAHRVIPPLSREVTQRDNRTPLLLPVRNFSSKHFVAALSRLHSALRDANDPDALLGQFVKDFERQYPPTRSGDGSAKYHYADDRNVEFRAPGRNRHAFARPSKGHPPTCVLSGRRRLGAPYDPAFHYDCVRGRGNLKEMLFGCHEPEPGLREGAPHLNIAPNDFIR